MQRTPTLIPDAPQGTAAPAALTAPDAPPTPDDAAHAAETPGAAGHLKSAVIAILIFTVALGLISPIVMTGVAQVAFPKQANGSLIPGPDGQPVGSELIGQAIAPASQPFYFASRPSALSSGGTPAPYDASNSGGTNLSQTSQKQHDAVATNVAAAQAAYGVTGPIPADLAMASGSGLDPHITPEAARVQVAAIVANRTMAGQRVAAADVQRLVDANTDGRTLGLLGQPRVNVLQLNLALDAQFGKPTPRP